MRSQVVSAAVAPVLLWLGIGQGIAAPLPCDDVTPTECVVKTLKNVGGTVEVDRTLHIAAGGELRAAPGTTLSLKIDGGFTMDIGAMITGNAGPGASRGAVLEIDSAGAVRLAGNGTSGAVIAADQLGGSCTGGRGGTVKLFSSFKTSGAAILTESGSRISADSRCTGGNIKIHAKQGGVDIRGVVRSVSTLSGTGAYQAPGGGPISIRASCDLTINETGRVSSRGGDPGADLVQLVAGGNVVIIGLVESTGPGHAVPNSPKTSCVGPFRPDKPAYATACVEVWAGKSLLIDATGTNNGEINADTGQSGGALIAWIDLFANGNIAIAGDGTGAYLPGAHPYAVHANEFVSNSHGGLIAVKSKSGQVTLSGQAIQADGGLSGASWTPSAGGQGGVVTVEAGGVPAGAGDVTVGASSVRARGADSGGGWQAGGDIAIRSFNGQVLGAAPGELNAGGGWGQGAPDPGVVALTACTGASYAGTSTPAATSSAACGGAPALPAYVAFPASACDVQPCVPPDCPCVPPDCPHPCVPPECPYPNFCLKGTVQAVLDPATGRFPGNVGADVVVDLRTQSLQSAVDAASDLNGDGYVIVGVVAQDGGMPGGTSTQMLTVGRSYPEPFALIGCSVLLNDPLRCDGIPAVHVEAGATSPEHPAGTGVTLYFQEITVAGSQSSPGWLAQGNGRFFEAVGGRDSMFGLTVVGDRNTLHNVTVERNATGGVVLQGNGNTVDALHAYTNSGPAGVLVTGDGNQVAGSAVGDRGRGNDGVGILVTGRANLVSGNTVLSNGGDGINVSGGTAGQPNVVKLNVSGSPVGGNHGIGIVLGGVGNGSGGPMELEGNTVQTNVMGGIKVTGSGHQLKNNVSGGFLDLDNTGCNYSVAPFNLNAGGNKAKYLLIPGVNSPFPTICIH